MTTMSQLNNGPLLGDLMALDSLQLDYKDIEKFETDDQEAHIEAVCVQWIVEEKRKEIGKHLFWN